MRVYKFTSDRKSFWTRFNKPFFVTSLVFFVLSFITKRNSHPLNEIFSICAVFSIILIIFLFVRFYNVVDEVQIVERRIVFIGHKFNTPWEKEFDINEAKIQVVSKGKGRGEVGYYLKISCNNHYYSVNRAFTWEYENLINLFNVFKEIKKEKISPTEKWLLGMMEKKASGYSIL